MSSDPMIDAVSIIISTRNRAASLRDTLASLEAVHVPADLRAELIVVDNGSTDGTQEVIRSFSHPELSCRLLVEMEPSKSVALNTALREASGDVLLFTDDDVRVPTDWIAGMSEPIRQGEADAVVGGIRLSDTLQKEWMGPAHTELLAGTEELEADNVKRLIGANMAVARRVFEVIPGFDPALGPGQGTMGIGEETLLTLQMRQLDLKIVTAFDVVVEHHPLPSRLQREGLVDIMRSKGKAEAYIAYHWRHADPSRLWSWAALLYWGLRLMLHKLRQGGGEGKIGKEEIRLRRRMYYHKQMISLCGERRAYDRMGSRRRNPGISNEGRSDPEPDAFASQRSVS